MVFAGIGIKRGAAQRRRFEVRSRSYRFPGLSAMPLLLRFAKNAVSGISFRQSGFRVERRGERKAVAAAPALQSACGAPLSMHDGQARAGTERSSAIQVPEPAAIIPGCQNRRVSLCASQRRIGQSWTAATDGCRPQGRRYTGAVPYDLFPPHSAPDASSYRISAGGRSKMKSSQPALECGRAAAALILSPK